MAFRDFPFPEYQCLFPTRAQVLGYLHQFADYADVRPLTRFRTSVESIERAEHYGPGKSKWRVQARSLEYPGEVQEDSFDYVAIASGWARVPRIPHIQGSNYFKGQQFHSAWYRTPVPFRGKRVLIVGNFSSGADIARELCGGSVRSFDGVEEWQSDANANPPRTGTVVYNSYRDPSQPPPLDYDPRDKNSPAWCKRINVVACVDHFDEDGSVILGDGTKLEVDVIFWATGFWRTLPFLDQKKEPFTQNPIVPSVGSQLDQVEGADPVPVLANDELSGTSSLTNLDDWQIFYESDKTLALVGVPNHIIPFHFTHIQSRYVTCLTTGSLPSIGPDAWRSFHDSILRCA